MPETRPATAADTASSAEPSACSLATTGRRSGRAHRIEIWFASLGSSFYLISGGGSRSDWVRNLIADPHATVDVGGDEFAVTARLPLAAGPERDRAVRRLHGKYAGAVSGTVDDWRRGAFIVALDRVEAP